MSTSSVTISVIIPTHNRADALAETLSRLAKQDCDRSWEVIVVNNRCTDNTDEVVGRQTFPVPLRLVHQEERPGPAAARNTGVAAAAGKYLVFIDNDILVEADFLQRHCDALEANPGCWLQGYVVNLPELEATPFGRFRRSLYPRVAPTQGLTKALGITAANLSLLRADFHRLGGFDESFFVASGEDREFAMRAWKAGITILFDPSIVVLHNDWAGASIRDYCLRQRIYTQTEPLFWRKYGDEYPRQQLVRENLPPDWREDDVTLVLWKYAKRVFGSKAGQAALLGICAALERILPWPPLLWRCYRLALAGAIYRGFQEGLRLA